MKQKKMLVIDDDSKMQKMMSTIFENQGFKIELADSGEMALEILHSMKPNIILTDINMPGISGFELCNKVRGIDSLKNTPVIILSASPSDANRKLAASSGASELMGKPFVMKELVNKVIALTNQ